MIKTIHRAKYVLAEGDLLLQNGAVYVSESGRISRVEPWHDRPSSNGVEILDWGSAVILPGLVNSHTHLELTGLHRRITGFSSFTDWLTQLIHERRQWAPADYEESVRRGAELSLAAGTTFIGDISASGNSARVLKSTALRKVVFEEVLGLSPEKAAENSAGLEARLVRAEEDPLLTIGISPHAPYSTAADLYRTSAAAAARLRIPMATHLAESKGEEEFLREGSGEFVEFLTRLGAMPPSWKPPGLSPVSYLDSLGVLRESPLLVHCNYLDRESMAAILLSRSSVAYCPRSHAFFGHDPHPVRELLDIGVNVALGTDSLASNETLSILDEMRFLFRARKDIKYGEIMQMATINGALALRLGGVLGRLRRGYWADMTVLRLPENASGKYLASQILEGAGECVGTIVQGTVAWAKEIWDPRLLRPVP